MNNTEKYIKLVEIADEYGVLEVIYLRYGNRVRVNIPFIIGECDKSIEDMDFSVRCNNALKRADINTVGKLIDCLNEGTVKGIRNLGKKSFLELQTKLTTVGYMKLDKERKIEFFRKLDEINGY